jgi:hypothetical protein
MARQADRHPCALSEQARSILSLFSGDKPRRQPPSGWGAARDSSSPARSNASTTRASLRPDLLARSRERPAVRCAVAHADWDVLAPRLPKDGEESRI